MLGNAKTGHVIFFEIGPSCRFPEMGDLKLPMKDVLSFASLFERLPQLSPVIRRRSHRACIPDQACDIEQAQRTHKLASARSARVDHLIRLRHRTDALAEALKTSYDVERPIAISTRPMTPLLQERRGLQWAVESALTAGGMVLRTWTRARKVDIPKVCSHLLLGFSGPHLSDCCVSFPEVPPHNLPKMVMPISFLDYLDTRKVFKGYKEPKSSESSSGSQTPDSIHDEKEARNVAGARNGNGVVPSTAQSIFLLGRKLSPGLVLTSQQMEGALKHEETSCPEHESIYSIPLRRQ